MPYQTVKNRLKRSNCSKWIFFLKTNNKSSFTQEPLSFCKIFKKFLELIQSYKNKPFSGPKWPICPNNFFWYKPLVLLSSYLSYYFHQIFSWKHLINFHLPISPFHSAKFKNISYSESRVMRMHHFWVQNGLFAPKKNFFGKKLLISFSSSYWPLSFCKILKRFLQ